MSKISPWETCQSKWNLFSSYISNSHISFFPLPSLLLSFFVSSYSSSTKRHTNERGRGGPKEGRDKSETHTGTRQNKPPSGRLSLSNSDLFTLGGPADLWWQERERQRARGSCFLSWSKQGPVFIHSRMSSCGTHTWTLGKMQDLGAPLHIHT